MMESRAFREQKHYLKMTYPKGNIVKVDHLTLLNYNQPNKKFANYINVK